jgi:hypothetical protein
MTMTNGKGKRYRYYKTHTLHEDFSPARIPGP